jgi:hypothetical protein
MIEGILSGGPFDGTRFQASDDTRVVEKFDDELGRLRYLRTSQTVTDRTKVTRVVYAMEAANE